MQTLNTIKPRAALSEQETPNAGLAGPPLDMTEEVAKEAPITGADAGNAS